MDYRHSLNLPKTEFPMKANLPAVEPERIRRWDAEQVYQKQREARKDAPDFVLHDGPPYANGDIHTGTALNKILKDMINRFWAMEGYDVTYVPGWDTHGLPIEMRALKSLGVSQHQIDAITLRRECAKVALHYIGVMTEQFKRLGVMGDWENPYITMKPAYEGAELAVFADMVEKGLIYRDLKSVYWCPHCETALAEGEIEYKPHESDSIYVAFSVTEAGTTGLPPGTRAVIWTTTPWTIPANVAIALHADLAYQVVSTEKGPLLLAESLVDSALNAMNLTNQGVVATFRGRDLEGVNTEHPYLGHFVPLILGEHVTAESGTGLVHTAPGHGVEDFEIGKKYGLQVVQPLDDQGRYYPGTPVVEGLFYQDANPVVNAKLSESGALLASHKLTHQYAYCWRCKNPVIYRATSQWFMTIDQVREKLDQATLPVRWDPEWGGERMRRMVADRDDWCLSRQRVWGVPIPAFYCQSCGESILSVDLIRRVAAIIAQEGADSWWLKDAQHFLPDGYRCPKCNSHEFRQERDIFDVWLDSGSSQAAVLADHPQLSWPADLVLEGNDQYRGWFNSLLTTGVATRGRAPYKMVLTHGMVLDKFGQEMHKSLGNTVDPIDLVNRFGSDILRLWVATSDYRTDVRISDDIMKQLSESYRKIRNTFRFLLGNLYDYDAETFSPGAVHDPLNRWAVFTINAWMAEARDAYRHYAFHTMVHGLLRLMTIDLSNFYLDVIKDRLYTLRADDPMRRETQSVLYYILHSLVRAVAPVLVFTGEEIYEYAPKTARDPESIHLASWFAQWPIDYSSAEQERMNRLLAYREVILKALEEKRAAKEIGNSLESRVMLEISADDPSLSSEDQDLLTEMTLSAEIIVSRGEPLTARAERVEWQRCDRCWRYTPDVGQNKDYPDLCIRCGTVLVSLGS